MKCFAFKNDVTPNLYAITPDREGAKIDGTKGPWSFFKEFNVEPGQRGVIGLPTNSDQVLLDLEGAGVHYVLVGLNFDVFPSR